MTLDDDTSTAEARLSPSSGSHIAQGTGSVVVGGANEAPITTHVTQIVRQFLLFGRRIRPSLDEAARHLEAEVHKQWSEEAIHLQVSGDHRLPVRWAPARAGLCAGVVEARQWMVQRVPTVLEARGGRWATSDDDLAGIDLDLVDV